VNSHPGLSLHFLRCEANPILTASDWPYPVHTVFNPGATRLADGSTLLLCRVEDTRGISHLCAARSQNGIDHWVIDRSPTLVGDPTEACWGVEDPRITYVPELAKYVIAYTAYTKGGPGVCLALTKDFRDFERLGLVMQPDDKDAALLPRRFDGNFALIHRPLSDSGAHIWVSFSPDLRNWGSHQLVLKARKGGWWDANKIGLSPPLVETPLGWLMLYHGVKHTAAGCLYRVGAALLAIDDPSTCLLRGDSWIFGPEAPYECHGDVSNVVFPCGYVLGKDGDELRIYYGCADTCIGLAIGSVQKLLGWLDEGSTRHTESSPPISKAPTSQSLSLGDGSTR
jgi:predicted GH43/DUF377 family glycosyl hydrolase